MAREELDAEEDIFAGISCYGFSRQKDEEVFSSAKFKAQKQLAISSDSPFNREDSDTHQDYYNERALLKQEAEKILREQEDVRGRQSGLTGEIMKKHEQWCTPENAQNLTAGPSSKARDSSGKSGETKPKLRPLTGRTDCPNCPCDANDSDCTLCTKMDRRASIFLVSDSTRGNTLGGDNKKRCTIKELRHRYAPRIGDKVSVSDRIVPGRVYTISKSLDEKRAKLAQTISELELMRDQLKEKGDRLDQERKIVQLYKDQWRFGPSIGGPKSSSHDRLGPIQQQRNYKSRLDPQLARDSRSLEAFKQIEPGLRLRQYEKRRPPNASQSRQALSSTKRSKSLESLKRAKNASRQDVSPKSFAGRKSSSDADLSSPPMVLEDEISVVQLSPPEFVVDENEAAEEKMETNKEPEMVETNSVQRLSWVPPVGQTEIKTVDERPKLKFQVAESRKKPQSKRIAPSSRSILKGTNSTSSCNGPKEQSSGSNERLVIEASRKLKFASDLLAKEQLDSTTKNQLVVNKSQNVNPTSSKTSVSEQRASEDKSNESKIKEMLLIEEQLNEHQRQIAKLVAIQEQRSKSSKTRASENSNNEPHSNRIPLGNRSLINNLRERLNKTKTRLARNLEAEREKYMRLKLKVDTSLRKQSDLEKENELLKQSLSQCIDACLKDISQTFESLSNSLADTVGSRQPVDNDLEIYSSDSSDLLLKNAAQVLGDNNKLREMKSRMDAVMQQRREIFDELSKEKQKSNQLELQLKRSQNELSSLVSAKEKLELRLQQEECHGSPTPPPTTSTSGSSTAAEASGTQVRQAEQTDCTDDTSGSLDRYRAYIKSLSPDLATLRQERKHILSEFDNIKKMLSEINSES